jgi:hypothetical protein
VRGALQKYWDSHRLLFIVSAGLNYDSNGILEPARQQVLLHQYYPCAIHSAPSMFLITNPLTLRHFLRTLVQIMGLPFVLKNRMGVWTGPETKIRLKIGR